MHTLEPKSYVKNQKHLLFFFNFVLKMEFLRECAKRLETETADVVLEDMRKRYKTTRCLRVKTGLVRKMYNGPDSEEFKAALSKLLFKYSGEFGASPLILDNIVGIFRGYWPAQPRESSAVPSSILQTFS